MSDTISPLLQETIRAHDPDDRWKDYSELSARMTVRGALWELKGVAGLFEDVTLSGPIADVRDTIAPFTGPDQVGVFTPERTAIVTADGTVVQESLDPLRTFAGLTRSAPWDALQALYFASYANWNYLVAPFIYATRGFSTRENGTWEEDGHQWRRLEITYPAGFPTHSEVQQIYLDDAGLIARLDYSVDILGGGPAAHYPSDYHAFDGVLVPTRRVVYVRRPDASPDRSSTSIDIIYSDIQFS